VEGSVTDTDGTPVPGARIEVWEADGEGFYDVQSPTTGPPHAPTCSATTRAITRFWGLTPTPYPIPHDGPVGSLLEAAGRSPMRASHLHFMASAAGKRSLVTHIFVHGDELLTRDAVFDVRDSLVQDFEQRPAGTPTPEGRALADRAWSRVRFDIVLAPAGA
jgi:hydroxyquinol 1,2-dioxygenase